MQINEQLLDIQNIKNSKKNLLDLFIRRTAVLTSTSEALCEKIIKDQWANANKKTQSSSKVSEIDFCNLGTIYLSKNKANRRVERLEESNVRLADLVEPDGLGRKNPEHRIKVNNDIIRSIKYKITKVRQDDKH